MKVLRTSDVTWRHVLLSLLLGAVVSQGGLVAATASAHGGGDEDSAEHAAQDLAGRSMDRIERATAARAEALGLDGADDGPSGGRTPAAVDPARLGAWSAVVDTPVVAVFSAVLPDATVLMWDSVGDNGVDSYHGLQTFTRAAVWDPATDTSQDVRLEGYNIFCAGFVQLPDGDVLVAGGNGSDQQEGIVQTHLFHWRTRTWTRGPDMSGERWYPSVAALGDGSALIVAGGPRTAEVYTPGGAQGSLRPLIGFDSFALRQYPFLAPRPGGLVEVVGPEWQMYRYDTAGSGTKTFTGLREPDYLNRNYGSFASYLPDKVLVTGGGTADQPGVVTSSPLSVVVDLAGSGPETPTRPVGPMASGRRQQSLTVLADGSVAVTGGMDSTDQDLVDLPAAVRTAERWDPETGTWSTLAAAQRVREYHSSAVLLADGRVMTGGGGVCGACVAAGYLEKNVEYLSPPYLFDATGRPAVRPGLVGVPDQVDDATPFSFTSSSAPDIAKVALVRLGADTHSVDQGQRYVPLSFTRSGATITATGPADGNQAPPGYYLMFAVTTAGVPSMGAMVHVGAVGIPDLGLPTPVPASPVSTPAAPVPAGPVLGPPAAAAPARCFEATSSAGRTSRVVRWTCSGEASQRWRHGPHQTLRVLGRCLGFGRGGPPRLGARAALSPCSTAAAQRVAEVGRTIRPAARRDLCMAGPGTSLVAGQRLRLEPCDGSPAQRWRT